MSKLSIVNTCCFILALVSVSLAQETTTSSGLQSTTIGKLLIDETPTTTAAAAVSTSAETTDNETEPPTSTVDSIGFGAANSSVIIMNGSDEDESTSAEEPESSGEIESKSLHSVDSAGPNSVADSNAKLTVLADATSGSEQPDPAGAGAELSSGAAASVSGNSRPGFSGRRLNMSRIDEVFTDERKDEDEIVESWHKMGKQLKKGIGSIIGSMVPMALNMSHEAKISSNCSGAMLKWILSMNQLKAWAMKMLDASGKPVAGLLEGSMTMFGNYRQCLKVRAPDDDEIEFAGEFREYFRGKYCVVQAKPWLPKKDRFYGLNTKLKALMESSEDNPWYDRTIFEELNEWFLAFNYVNIRMDLCIPSMCSREDIQKVVNYLTKGIDLKTRVLRCETESHEGGFGGLFKPTTVEAGSNELANTLAAQSAVTAASTYETSSENNNSLILALLFNSQLAWLLVPTLAICLVVLATLLSVAMSNSSSFNKRRTKFSHTIASLSLKRSFSSHLNVDYEQLADDKPLALYGIKFLLVFWVLLVESAVNLKFEYLRELLMLKDFIFWWPMQFIINSTLQFDSIILLTAFTMGYKNCLNDSTNNAKSIIRFIIDKYIRLMPSIMVMVALVILLPLAYSGPVWNDYVTKQSAVCQSNGWLNTVFLQNYLPYKEICLPQTWLVCIEFQLVLLMAPLVYYLNKYYNNSYDSNGICGNNKESNHKSTIGGCRRNDASKLFYWFWTIPGMIMVGLIAIGLGSSFYNVFSNDLPPSWFYTMADPDSKALYFDGHFMRLWTHLAVFSMGLLAGIECRRASKNVLRSYRNANIDFISTNSLTLNAHDSNAFRKYHQSHHNHNHEVPSSASSTSSLPVMSQSESLISKSSNPDMMSSISININSNYQNYNNNNNNNNHNNNNGVHKGYINNNINNNNNNGNNIKTSKSIWSTILNLIGCLIAISIMSALIFSTHDWSLNDLPKPIYAGLYDASSRFLWSLAFIWMLYMVCVPNKNKEFSFVSKSLGHPIMVCLGKLSFLIYLIHPFVHTTVLAIQEQPIYSSWLMLAHILIGNITITVILASIVSLFVEMPFRNLFRRCETSLLLAHNVVGASTTSGAASSTTASTGNLASLR